MISNYDFCNSSYLTFRYIVKKGVGWKTNVIPNFPDQRKQDRFIVNNSENVIEKFQNLISEFFQEDKTGILLSGGIDSAIIAAFLPSGSYGYTIQFEAEDAIDETERAEKVAKIRGLKHRIIKVTWEDYKKHIDFLIKRKRAPLHPAEIAIYIAAVKAAEDKINVLFTGNGADSTFGGMDKLLSKDWTFYEFVKRYTFLESARILRKPVSMLDTFEKYRNEGKIDVIAFLKTVHGSGIIQMFENAIASAGCSMIAPFEKLSLGQPLDLKRIRNGEPKYILNEVFRKLYKNTDIAKKIPFVRPMDRWLKNWPGPVRPEFIENLSMNEFSGEQKWQMFCLECFLNLLENGEIL